VFSLVTHVSFLPFPSLSPPLSAWAVAPQIQISYLGSAVIDLPAEKNVICSHQTRSLGSKYTYNAFAAEVSAADAFLLYLETCLVVANVVLFLLKEV